MADIFKDIKIASLDYNASGPSGQGSLMRLVLRLSQSAPSRWSQHFNQSWQQHLYMQKRHAAVSGDKLEIVCMMDELERDHLPEVKKIIAATNEAYGAYAKEQDHLQRQAEEDSMRQKEELASLKKRLKLD